MVGPAKVCCQEITPHNRSNPRGLLGEKERVWEWGHERKTDKKTGRQRNKTETDLGCLGPLRGYMSLGNSIQLIVGVEMRCTWWGCQIYKNKNKW